MGEISPIPANGVDPIRFEQFKSDLKLLLGLITQEELGGAMNIRRSNMNGYIKGTQKITKGFLKKFYAAWGERITEERAKVRNIDSEYTRQNQKEPTISDIMTVLLRIEDKMDRQEGRSDEKN